jgi:hypothetical protein
MISAAGLHVERRGPWQHDLLAGLNLESLRGERDADDAAHSAALTTQAARRSYYQCLQLHEAPAPLSECISRAPNLRDGHVHCCAPHGIQLAPIYRSAAAKLRFRQQLRKFET